MPDSSGYAPPMTAIQRYLYGDPEAVILYLSDL